jgi:dihydroxy-acid dehydratase
VCPEAYVGGPIGLVQDGDIISIDAETREMNMDVTEEELAKRRANFKTPEPKYTKGTLARYIMTVKSASQGAVTDEL